MTNEMRAIDFDKVFISHHAASRYNERYKYDSIQCGLREHILNELKEIKINRLIQIKDVIHIFTSYNREYILCKADNGWTVKTIKVHKNKKEATDEIRKLLNKSKKKAS